MTLSISNDAAIAACNAIVDLADTGTGNPSAHLKIYSGTPPANVDASLSGNTLLADLTMSNPAFGDAADVNPGAEATANAITSDLDADAAGTATFYRIENRAGVAKIQGAVDDTAGAELVLNSVEIQLHAKVEITSLKVKVPEA